MDHYVKSGMIQGKRISYGRRLTIIGTQFYRRMYLKMIKMKYWGILK